MEPEPSQGPDAAPLEAGRHGKGPMELPPQRDGTDPAPPSGEGTRQPSATGEPPAGGRESPAPAPAEAAPAPRGEEQDVPPAPGCAPELPPDGNPPGDAGEKPPAEDGGSAAGAPAASPGGGAAGARAEPPQTRSPSREADFYCVKWITWKGERTPVITQSENGPCPLLAIMNVLFLQWKASGVRGAWGGSGSAPPRWPAARAGRRPQPPGAPR